MKFPTSLPEKPWFLIIAISSLIVAVLLLTLFLRSPSYLAPCYSTTTTTTTTPLTPNLTAAILHYATTSTTPQQNLAEISISYRVLLSRSPANFLVFGLGHDSIMWHSFNPLGTTLFLEEDPKWLTTILKLAPFLNAHAVKYPTKLSQADDLLKSWKSQQSCLPEHAKQLKGNRGCKLALADLPGEVYRREWDMIMIDAPKGYFNEAPGRMGAIYSAAVMARNRKGPGPTDVFLHDVDRRVEKMFAMEFLCKKNLVEGKGRLWHFRIFPTTESGGSFC